MNRQLSLFSAASSPASAHDLEGLLAAGAQLTCRPHLARLSVRLAEEWRVAAISSLLAELGLQPERLATRDGAWLLRTAFHGSLMPLAVRWTAGSVKRPPEGLCLEGARLRWWCLAAGWTGGDGYRLGLGAADEDSWPGIGAALARAGLPAAFVAARPGPPAYRISGGARLRRLRELVGEPPTGVPSGAWPDAAAGMPELTIEPVRVHTPPAQ